MTPTLARYAEFIGSIEAKTRTWSRPGAVPGWGMSAENGIAEAATMLRVTGSERVKALLFGNGGSLTIADHIANDFNLCAGWRSLALSNPSNLSAIGNDFELALVFEKQLEWIGRRGDIAIAISCSGTSPNVVLGARKARAMGMAVITLSASDIDNDLVKEGDVNFWVDTRETGLAQVAHLVLLHAICDIGAGERNA